MYLTLPICDLAHRACFAQTALEANNAIYNRRAARSTKSYKAVKSAAELEKGESIIKDGVKIGMAYKK